MPAPPGSTVRFGEVLIIWPPAIRQAFGVEAGVRMQDENAPVSGIHGLLWARAEVHERIGALMFAAGPKHFLDHNPEGLTIYQVHAVQQEDQETLRGMKRLFQVGGLRK